MNYPIIGSILKYKYFHLTHQQFLGGGGGGGGGGRCITQNYLMGIATITKDVEGYKEYVEQK